MLGKMDFGEAGDYANSKATEAIACSVARQSLFPDNKSHALSSFAAGLLIYAEKKTGIKTEDIIRLQGREYKSIHKSLARGIDTYGEELVYDRKLREMVYSDLTIQLKAQEILSASIDPVKEKALDISEQYLAQAIREDGGDLKRLMVHRASGQYHKLTLDQQDDIVVAMQNGDALEDKDKNLVTKMVTSAEIASASINKGSLLDKTKEAFEALDARGLVNIISLTQQNTRI
jgi:hypothetical protein